MPVRSIRFNVDSETHRRAIFTIKDDTVYVLTVRRGAQGIVRPDDVDGAAQSRLKPPIVALSM